MPGLIGDAPRSERMQILLEVETMQDIERLARLDGVSRNQIAYTAIQEYLAARRKDVEKARKVLN